MPKCPHPLKFFQQNCHFFSGKSFGIYLVLRKINSKKEEIMNNIIKKTDNRPTTFGSVVDELFQSNLNRFFDDHSWGFNGLQTDARVPVNIRETDTAYEIQVIAPGLKKEDFNLAFTGDTLTVSFEHNEQKSEGDQKKWIRQEYRSASFSRSFTVDNTVNVDKANARYENGILSLTLPKKEEAKRLSRKIEIQ